MEDTTIKHIDLFSGIGGFAYAIDQVYGKTKHTFVEIDPFCQAVLRKNFPDSEIWGDVRTFTHAPLGDDRRNAREVSGANEQKKEERSQKWSAKSRGTNCFLLTGGFPCQPFSTAGVRKGTSDDRYLWPEMFRVISEFRPTWVIAENVRGLLTIQDGMVFEQVLTDLESIDYEVQAFVIPACAVGAPHRRDRVWIVAHSISDNDRTQEQRVIPET